MKMTSNEINIDYIENMNRKPKKEMNKKERIERAMGKLIFGGHCSANTKHIEKFARQLRYMESKGYREEVEES